MSLFTPKAVNFQPVESNTTSYLEESNILLQRMERYACGYEMTRKKIINLCSVNNINCPNISELALSSMMMLIIPRPRWNILIMQVFNGMPPPIVKHPLYNTYMLECIPIVQMTQQQKLRINEIGSHMSGAIWARLNRVEKWAVCEGIHGMKINIDNMYLSFHHSINKNKENTVEKKKRDEIVLIDSESTSDSDHNETPQRKSKRIRIQSHNK